jgi:hypothetical protein
MSIRKNGVYSPPPLIVVLDNTFNARPLALGALAVARWHNTLHDISI